MRPFAGVVAQPMSAVMAGRDKCRPRHAKASFACDLVYYSNKDKFRYCMIGLRLFHQINIIFNKLFYIKFNIIMGN